MYKSVIYRSTQSISDLLTSVGVGKDVYPPSPGQDVDAFALDVAWVFLGFYAIKTGLRVCVCEKNAAAVAAVLKEQKLVVPPANCVTPDCRNNYNMTALLSDIRLFSFLSLSLSLSLLPHRVFLRHLSHVCLMLT